MEGANNTAKIFAICAVRPGKRPLARVLAMPQKRSAKPTAARERDLLVMLFRCVAAVRELDSSKANLETSIGNLCSELEYLNPGDKKAAVPNA